jgi:hypothetical protein
MTNAGRCVEAHRMIYRPQDPKVYGSICPNCGKRWGMKKARGFIDIQRCDSCPTLERSEANWYKNKRLKALGEPCLKI